MEYFSNKIWKAEVLGDENIFCWEYFSSIRFYLLTTFVCLFFLLKMFFPKIFLTEIFLTEFFAYKRFSCSNFSHQEFLLIPEIFIPNVFLPKILFTKIFLTETFLLCKSHYSGGHNTNEQWIFSLYTAKNYSIKKIILC